MHESVRLRAQAELAVGRRREAPRRRDERVGERVQAELRGRERGGRGGGARRRGGAEAPLAVVDRPLVDFKKDPLVGLGEGRRGGEELRASRGELLRLRRGER